MPLTGQQVEKEDKKLNDKSSPSFGQRGATLINESGLYALIFGSKKKSIISWKRIWQWFIKAFGNITKSYFGKRDKTQKLRLATKDTRRFSLRK